MKTFTLRRVEDESGISGTGDVAQGVEFDCGYVVLCWTTTQVSVPTVGWYPNIDAVVKIHGHNGKTIVAWEQDP